MSDQDPSVTAAIAAIEAAAQGRWAAWLSDTGWWWATRTRTLTAAEIGAGCLPYIHADNPGEFAENIREQDRLCPPNQAAGGKNADHGNHSPADRTNQDGEEPP